VKGSGIEKWKNGWYKYWEENSMLRNQVAIVTGGSRGIGRAIVQTLVDEGASVVFTYNKNSDEAELLQSKLVDQGKNVVCVKANSRDYEGAERIALLAEEKFGKIDILINNAGIIRDSSLMMMTQEDWTNVIDVNLTGVFNYTRAVIVKMLRQKSGHIINIASFSGIFGNPGQTNYSASKAGIIGFTKSLAREVGAYDIRVNAIAPGFIETDMMSDIGSKYRNEILKRISLRRFGRPEEVASVIKFLLSSSSNYITGQVISIDGGLSL
jgi:3-oxoacyl-[acyl-carrier protein] reductase